MNINHSRAHINVRYLNYMFVQNLKSIYVCILYLIKTITDTNLQERSTSHQSYCIRLYNILYTRMEITNVRKRKKP